MGADGTPPGWMPRASCAAVAPLAVLQAWLDCRCLGVEWHGPPPAAGEVWVSLLQRAQREAEDSLRLDLGVRRWCRLRAVGETDCYAWEALLRQCGTEAMIGRQRLPPTPPSRRGLRRPRLDAGGHLQWEEAPPRCASTRRWLGAATH